MKPSQPVDICAVKTHNENATSEMLCLWHNLRVCLNYMWWWLHNGLDARTFSNMMSPSFSSSSAVDKEILVKLSSMPMTKHLTRSPMVNTSCTPGTLVMPLDWSYAICWNVYKHMSFQSIDGMCFSTNLVAIRLDLFHNTFLGYQARPEFLQSVPSSHI